MIITPQHKLRVSTIGDIAKDLWPTYVAVGSYVAVRHLIRKRAVSQAIVPISTSQSSNPAKSIVSRTARRLLDKARGTALYKYGSKVFRYATAAAVLIDVVDAIDDLYTLVTYDLPDDLPYSALNTVEYRDETMLLVPTAAATLMFAANGDDAALGWYPTKSQVDSYLQALQKGDSEFLMPFSTARIDEVRKIVQELTVIAADSTDNSIGTIASALTTRVVMGRIRALGALRNFIPRLLILTED